MDSAVDKQKSPQGNIFDSGRNELFQIAIIHSIQWTQYNRPRERGGRHIHSCEFWGANFENTAATMVTVLIGPPIVALMVFLRKFGHGTVSSISCGRQSDKYDI